MRKLLLLLPVLPALLAACGPGAPAVDPTTLTFVGKGSLADDNASVTSDYALSTTFGGKTLANVGTLKAGGAVNMQVTAAGANSLPSFSLGGWRGNWGKTCDVSQLTVGQDAPYVIVDGLGFTDEGKTYELYAQTITKNTDGTFSSDRSLFFYTTKSGSLTGEVSCANQVKRSFNVTLRPGWNIVHHKWTYNPTTQSYSQDSYGNTEQATTYDGPWVVYDVTE